MPTRVAYEIRSIVEPLTNNNVPTGVVAEASFMIAPIAAVSVMACAAVLVIAAAKVVC